MAAISEDFPASGKPTRPASATVFSSSTSVWPVPGSPRSANPGARRRGEASAALPRPPRPPCAATYLVRAPTRSASTSPSSVVTTVPSGTATIRSAPSAPLRFEPEPCLPLPARRTGRRCRSSSVAMPGSTSKMTSPPRPPFPPSGPPSGLNFSRCTDAQPCPPSPALTVTVTWSANSATCRSFLVPHDCRADRLAVRPSVARLAYGGLVRRSARFRDHAHGPAVAHTAERDHPADQREQGVVLAAADTGAGVEVGAALAHDDLARVDLLTAEPLDAQPLRGGVPAVPAR